MSQYGPGMTQGQEEGSEAETVEPSARAEGDATLEVPETAEAIEGVSPVIITGMLQNPFIRAYYVSGPDS